MTSTGPSPLPPTTILSTKSISQSSAHDFLAAYLARAATDPALQPNATVSEHGPVSHTTAAAPNLILHNLKRVQAGLAGEVLGRDLTFAKMGGDGEESGQQEEGQQEGVNGGEGWQDREKWEQQDEEDGGNGKNTEDNMEADNETAPSGGIDKEERKRKKKERRQAEKRAKAKAAEAEE